MTNTHRPRVLSLWTCLALSALAACAPDVIGSDEDPGSVDGLRSACRAWPCPRHQRAPSPDMGPTSPASQQGSAVLTWDPPATWTPAGYRVYFGTTAGGFASSVDVGTATAYTFSALSSGTYHFAVCTEQARRTTKRSWATPGRS